MFPGYEANRDDQPGMSNEGMRAAYGEPPRALPILQFPPFHNGIPLPALLPRELVSVIQKLAQERKDLEARSRENFELIREWP